MVNLKLASMEGRIGRGRKKGKEGGREEKRRGEGGGGKEKETKRKGKITPNS